jgi:WD40 repeat protein
MNCKKNDGKKVLIFFMMILVTMSGVGENSVCIFYQRAFLHMFQTGINQFKSLHSRHLRFHLRRYPMFAIGIYVGFQNRLQLVAGGRLCTMVAHKLLSLPGKRAIESPLRHAIAVLSRRHFFKDTPVTCVATFKEHSHCVTSVSFHRTDPIIATSGMDNIKLWRLSADGTVATCMTTLEGHSYGANSVALNPHNSFVATGSDDKTAKVWRLSADGTAATCVATLKGHLGKEGGHVTAVKFHPIVSSLLATCSGDETAMLWRLSADGTSATCVATLTGHRNEVSDIAFHPSAPIIATSSLDRTVKLWQMSADCTAVTCVATLKGHSNWVNSVTFHDNGLLMATCSDDNTAKLWRLSADGTAATCVATLEGHSSSVRSVAFHPTSPFLATSSSDNTAKVWQISPDLISATCVATLKGHRDSVRSVAFHPTAPVIATGSSDKTMKLWK